MHAISFEEARAPAAMRHCGDTIQNVLTAPPKAFAVQNSRERCLTRKPLIMLRVRCLPGPPRSSFSVLEIPFPGNGDRSRQRLGSRPLGGVTFCVGQFDRQLI